MPARPPRSPRTPYSFSLFSITLSLFFLGFLAVLALTGKVVVDDAKEQLVMKVMLTEGTTDEQASKLLQQLRVQPYVKEAAYHSRQDALKDFQELGDDFMKAMDNFNPFLGAIHIRLNADYIQSDSVRALSKVILDKNPEVFEINYPINLIESVNRNVDRATKIAIPVGILLAIIAFLLIINTIRLAIFSQRLLIRTMQLVGATAGFIRRPFVRMGLWQGFLAGILADLLLFGLLFLLSTQMAELDLDLGVLTRSRDLYILYIGLIVLGTLLGYFGSRMAVNRYLNKSLDEIA